MGALTDAGGFAVYRVTDGNKQIVFEGFHLVVRAEDGRFHVLEFVGDVAFLSGRGMGGVIAAFAAAAVKLPVRKLILTEVPASLRALLEKRTFRVPNSCLPNGMLKCFDFPELYALLQRNYDTEISCSEDVPPEIY